jgi:hypothetical protein
LSTKSFLIFPQIADSAQKIPATGLQAISRNTTILV